MSLVPFGLCYDVVRTGAIRGALVVFRSALDVFCGAIVVFCGAIVVFCNADVAFCDVRAYHPFGGTVDAELGYVDGPLRG